MAPTMPAFGRFVEEGQIIGRLLAGYGELELTLCACMIATTDKLDDSVRAMFSRRGEERRINTARDAIKADYEKAGLRTEFFKTVCDMHWCRQVRNQYAHCAWYDTTNDGLAFCDLEAMALAPAAITKIANSRSLVTVELLREQEAFFAYVRECFWYLEGDYRVWAGKLTSHPYERPQNLTRPPLHS